ncbi:sulfite exporter TauE/SafE family protein [Candidatus Dependentiae bacterium]
MIYDFFLIIILSFLMELIDSSLGMGYGTILSPLFIIIFEYQPEIVIPSILLSQAISGTIAGIFHNKYKNVSFKIHNKTWVENIKYGFTKELRFVLLISITGGCFTIVGATLTNYINPIILKTYISILTIGIGIITITKKRFVFSWKKIIGFGMLSTFNKGFTGGGFGPILTGGQILSGHKEKSAIGCTTLAEGPVCLIGFLAYLILDNVQGSLFSFLTPMIIGSVLASPIGAFLTKKINKNSLNLIISILLIILGAWTFTKIGF